MKEIYTALITPFDEDGSIDYKALSKLIDKLISEGNDSFVVCGTTGEVSTLRLHEKKQLIRYIRYHYPDVNLIIGLSSNSTNEIIKQINELGNINSLESFMVVVPYYNRPSQEGLFKHYDVIASSTSKNIIIYNVPSRTACNIETNTILKLLEKHKNIIGLKQAGSLDDVLTLKENYPFFKVYVGNDNLLKEALQKDVDGIISVVSHLDYKLIKDICDSENDFKDDYLKLLSKYIFIESSPAPLKYILFKLGYINNKLRLPLVNITKEHEKILDSIVEKYQ